MLCYSVYYIPVLLLTSQLVFVLSASSVLLRLVGFLLLLSVLFNGGTTTSSRCPAATRTSPASSSSWAASTSPRSWCTAGPSAPGRGPPWGSPSISAFQSYGEYLYDKITDAERREIVQHSCPGPAACGGMYTANTMATAIEALGMSLPCPPPARSSSCPPPPASRPSPPPPCCGRHPPPPIHHPFLR